MNIVVINPDQMRHDYATHVGHPFIGTRHLARLAAMGTAFHQAFVSCPMCGPSRTSVITGLYPQEHGVRNYGGTFDPSRPNVLTNLGRAGFRRALFGKDHIVADGSRVFGTLYDEGENICLGNSDDHPDYRRSFDSGPLEKGSRWDLTDRLTTAGIGFLERQRRSGQPFFLTLNYQDPHPYFCCPEPYASMFSPEQFALPPSFRREPVPGEPRRLTLWREHSGHSQAADSDLRRLMAIYAGQIRYVDDQVGRVLEALERLGLLETTLVLFWSDHGEYLNDYGVTHKQATFYDCLVRVPMVLFDPSGRVRPGANHDLVEAMDVFATMLDLVGVEQPQGSRAWSLVGDDYVPRTDVYAEGGLHVVPPTQAVPGLRLRAPFAPSHFGPGAMLRTRTHKLCVSAFDTWELYDLTAPACEQRNLIDEPACASVRRALTDRLVQRQLCCGQAPEHLPRFAGSYKSM